MPPAEPSEIDLRAGSEADFFRPPSPNTGIPTGKAGSFSGLRAAEEPSAAAEGLATPSATQGQVRFDGSPSLGQALQFVASPKDLIRDLGVDSELQRLQELNRSLAEECEAYRQENERLRSSYMDEQRVSQSLMTDLQVSQLLSGSLMRQNRELAGLIPVYDQISRENARHRRRESESRSRLADESVGGSAGGEGPAVSLSSGPSAASSLSLSETSDAAVLPAAAEPSAPRPQSGAGAARAAAPAEAPAAVREGASETERTYQKLYTALVANLTSLVGDRADAVLEASKHPGKPKRGRAARTSLPPAGPTAQEAAPEGRGPSNPYTDKAALIREYIKQLGDVQSLMDQLHASQTEAATLRRQLAEAGAELLSQQQELEAARRGAAEAEDRYRKLAEDYQRFCDERRQEILDNKYRFMSVQKTYDMLAKKYASLKQMTQDWLETRPYRPAAELACLDE